jgi:hypothetical protein
MHAWLGPHDKLKARFLLLRTWTVRCESLPTHCSSSICLAKQCSVRETTRPAAYQSHLYYRLIVPPPPPPSSVAIPSGRRSRHRIMADQQQEEDQAPVPMPDSTNPLFPGVLLRASLSLTPVSLRLL